jgi:hypothetical protein
MIENARRGGQQVVGVEMEFGKEKGNGRSEERGRRRDGGTGTASKSKKTSLALPRQSMPIYAGVSLQTVIKAATREVTGDQCCTSQPD